MIRKSNWGYLKKPTAWGQRNTSSGSQWQALSSRQASQRSYLNEMQHGEGEMLVTETAVHHHLDERQERAGQLSQGKHYLVRERETRRIFLGHS